MKSDWTAAGLLTLLAKRYPDPEYALLTQVADQTGWRSRIADAVAIGCWKSRGLYIHGFEIKVSRSDWLFERKHPEKAETIGQVESLCRSGLKPGNGHETDSYEHHLGPNINGQKRSSRPRRVAADAAADSGEFWRG